MLAQITLYTMSALFLVLIFLVGWSGMLHIYLGRRAGLSHVLLMATDGLGVRHFPDLDGVRHCQLCLYLAPFGQVQADARVLSWATLSFRCVSSRY